ncbi:MAG TPA: hypothetical protein DIV86_04565 [Alphaproteobacteria bacterium]|nr:hypothetical protein [Alphaproteobacteria bacterium]
MAVLTFVSLIILMHFRDTNIMFDDGYKALIDSSKALPSLISPFIFHNIHYAVIRGAIRGGESRICGKIIYMFCLG